LDDYYHALRANGVDRCLLDETEHEKSLFELHVVLDLVWVLFVSLCFTRTISKFYDALADQAQASSNLISVRSVEIWHYLVQGGVTQVHLDTDIVS
jgi:hypothetical protein